MFESFLTKLKLKEILRQVFQHVLEVEVSVVAIKGTLMSGLKCSGIALHHYNHSNNASEADLSFIVYPMAESQGCLGK